MSWQICNAVFPKAIRKKKWPAYLLSCWLQFPSSLLFSGPCITGERKQERGRIHKAPTKTLPLVSWLQSIRCRTAWLYGSSERNQGSAVYLEEPHVYRNKDTRPLSQSTSSVFFSEFIPIQTGPQCIHKTPPPHSLLLPGSLFGNKITDRNLLFFLMQLCAALRSCWGKKRSNVVVAKIPGYERANSKPSSRGDGGKNTQTRKTSQLMIDLVLTLT